MKNGRNPRNSEDKLYKRLTRIFSGPIVNRRQQNYRQEKRKKLDKYRFDSASGQGFKKASYSPFEHIQANAMANQNRSERYLDFDQMEFTPEIGCLDGTTKVATLEGFIEIKELARKYANNEHFEIWSWDHHRNCYTIGNAHHPRITGVKELIEVVIDNGKSLFCTADHRIMMKDGTYKQAGTLQPGESLNQFDYRSNSAGYLKLRTEERGKYKQAHRYIMEDVLSKDIGSDHVHHINEIKTDNRTVNLKVMAPDAHMKHHGISPATNKKRSTTCKELWNDSAYRERALAGLKRWQASEEGKVFMSEHTSRMNKKRWKEDLEYAEKMANIFSHHAKSLWADPEWRAWKSKHHSEVMKLKYANEPSLKERTRRVGSDNGRFNREITTEQILVEGLKFNSFVEFARNFDFGNRIFADIEKKTQFLRRRLQAAGFQSWSAYKRDYMYSNHKVIEVRNTGRTEAVYDLTVEHLENYCLENGMIVSNSSLDVYADEMTTHTSLEDMLSIDCPNEELKTVLNNLYRNIMNVNYNLFGWCRSTCKYGDFFLYLDIDEKEGIQNVIGLPAHEVERLEGEDKTNPNYVQYQWNSGGMTFENWQVAHFRILGNDKYAPYGTSVLESSRRIWRQLTLLEDAMMAYRIVRAPERRVFYIDVGHIAANDVEQYMQKAITQMKRNQVVNDSTGRVDLRYNPLSVEEDYFIPVRGQTSSKIEPLPGGQYTGDIDDVKYLRDKLFSALKVPQSYLSRGDGASEDKTTLAQKDIRFARTIQRLQRTIVGELEKIGIVHLYTLGFRGDDLLAFKLRLNNPSKIAELQDLEHWRTRFDVASAATEGYFSRRWVAKSLFNLTDEEFLRNQREMFYDRKFEAMLDAVVEGSEEEGGLGSLGGMGSDTLGDDEMDLGLADDEMDLGSGGEEAGVGELGDTTEDDEDNNEADDSALLAAPAGKRDDKLTTTPKSKGKNYKPVKYTGGDRRGAGARKRHNHAKWAKEKSSGTKRNVMGSGAQEIASMGNGIYEQWETSYIDEMRNMEKDSDMKTSEQKIFDINKQMQRLVEEMEKRDNEEKKDKTKA